MKVEIKLSKTQRRTEGGRKVENMGHGGLGSYTTIKKFKVVFCIFIFMRPFFFKFKDPQLQFDPKV